MLKRLLLAMFTFLMLSFTANIAFAESFIRDDILRLSYCNFNDKEMFVRIPCKAVPCAIPKNPCICENPCVKPCNPCETVTPCEEKLPCNPCQKFKAGWKNGCNCDMHIKRLHEFLSKADCAVGLTPEQKQNANSIRKNAAQEIIELKRDIATKESKILGLKNSSNCACNNDKEINSLNRDIDKMQRDVERICKEAKKDYKRMLNSEQKRAFKNYKKQWESNPDIVSNSPCPCNK